MDASEDLASLLLLVADDGARDVIICPPDLDWLFHPYDGGADVIASDHTAREDLRRRHSTWLSAHPQGL